MTVLQNYKDMLKKNGCTTKYFTKAFLDTFTTAYNARKENIENGIFNSYGTAGYEYNAILETPFYKSNSCAYCVFLENYNGWSFQTRSGGYK